MKKLVGALAVGALLALGGCQSAINVLNGNLSNPLTPSVALRLHAGFDAGVVVAAGDYASLPRCPAVAPCSQQSIVNTLRTYVNAANGTLTQLDQWAVGNTKLDGPALFNAAVIAVSQAENFAATNGLKFKNAPGT